MSNILLELRAERDRVREHLDRLNKDIEYYERIEGNNSSEQLSQKTNDFKYRKGDTLKETVINYVNKALVRFSLSSQIAEQLIEYFPIKKGDFNSFKTQISTILSLARTDNLIASYRIGKNVKDTVWGNKQWLDKNGKVINGREYIDKDGNVRQEYK